MPLVGTRANASARAYGFTSGAPEVLGGMVLITPTSIASTGTGNSSSINANGSVTFSTCETLSLNGVFTADYDNYVVSIRATAGGTTEGSFLARLRSSGTDSTATTDYNSQQLSADSTTITGQRRTADGFFRIGRIIGTNDVKAGGYSVSFYGPYLSQPTAFRSTDGNGSGGAAIYDFAGTHELSSSYDGVTLFAGIGGETISGLVSVYGLVGA
jgi:hypothetical protein